VIAPRRREEMPIMKRWVIGAALVGALDPGEEE
jgi:hypothetical protein